jgi:hypothetical protein
MRSILGGLVSALFVVGCAGSTPTAAPPAASAPAAASPSQSGAFGGTVQFKYHGQPSTTTVDAVADGTSLSGTAVTQIGTGTHTVQLGCAAQSGDMWAVGGKTEKSNVEGGRAGDWSAVIMKLGSPAKIGIWVSEDASTATDCDAWLKAVDLPTLDLTGFETVESGTLVPPPASAFAPQPAASASAATKPGGFGGVVDFKLDGAAATTTVDGVADGTKLSGTAVTTFREGTHTVQLACASQNGGTWALGGTVEKTTVPGESPGAWSAVIIKDGSPQQVAIWLSGEPGDAKDCDAWLKATDFSAIGSENFSPVDAGTLQPPAFPAP